MPVSIRLTDAVSYRLNDYIDKLALYDGRATGVITIDSSAISSRVLRLAIPKGGMTAAQRVVIEAAQARAQTFDVDLIITQF
jgi:hypothetical protein